jgi:hypothetical protein
MVTVEQILAAEGEELSRLLGEVLHNKESFEQWKTEVRAEDRLLGYKDMGKLRTPANERQLYEMYLKESPFDPIALDDFNIAMAWRDWAVKEYGGTQFMRCLIEDVCWSECESDGEEIHDFMTITSWLSIYIKPKHYLQAAAIAKLNAEKGK